MQRQTAVAAYFSSKQLLLFAFALAPQGSWLADHQCPLYLPATHLPITRSSYQRPIRTDIGAILCRHPYYLPCPVTEKQQYLLNSQVSNYRRLYLYFGGLYTIVLI